MKTDLLEYRSWHLNVFRAYGSKSHCEDNVTRALLCVIAKSASGDVLLENLLRRCASCAARDDVSNQTLPLLEKAIDQIRTASVGTQAHMDLGTADEPQDWDFSVLIELTPTNREARALAPTPQLQDAAGRFDAILKCGYGNGSSFLVVAEAKLYGDESDEKLQKYRQILGPDSCISVKLNWADIFGLLDCLPDQGRLDPISRDFIEYLEDLWWLAGFRGFRVADFQERERSGRYHKLRQLASELVLIGDASKPSFACSRPLRDPADLDLLPIDQFKLIGNVGLATWDDVALYAKLVIGSFRFDYEGDPDLTEKLRAGSGRQWAIAESYYQFKQFTKMDIADIRKLVDRANDRATDLGLTAIKASIGFRCFFGRFGDNDVWISSRQFDTAVDEGWQNLVAALNCAKSLESETVTVETMQRVYPFVTDESELTKVALVYSKLDGAPKKRDPKHHASALFTIQMGWAKVTSEKPNGQVKLAGDALAVLLGLLRDFSGATVL
jgi:hypothetical protein